MFYQCLTDFIFVEHQPQQADIIFVPGGNYPDSAQFAAVLYKKGYAPVILPSGKYSILKGYFEAEQADQHSIQEVSGKTKFRTEWEYLQHILVRNGVPESAILREDNASFTWENAIFSKAVLKKKGIHIKKAIIVCQAFHARRALMYYQEQFPEVEFLVCPVETKGISKDNWHTFEQGIDVVLGEVERCGAQFHDIMRAHMTQRPESEQ